MKNEYLAQAKKFLKDTNTELTVTFLKKARHFPGDAEVRDVYTVSMVRNGNSYTFEFGDSLKNTETNYNRGSRIKPNAYDILACLSGYEVGTVDDVAADYGIEKPSEVIRTHKALTEEHDALSKMYSETELEALREIQ